MYTQRILHIKNYHQYSKQEQHTKYIISHMCKDWFQKLCDIEKVAKKALLTSNEHNFDLLYW